MEQLEQKIRNAIKEETDGTAYLNEVWENKLTTKILLAVKESIPMDAPAKPACENSCLNCAYNERRWNNISFEEPQEFNYCKFLGVEEIIDEFCCNFWSKSV